MADVLRPLSLAAPAGLLARLDALRASLARSEPWARPSRSCAARKALEAGLAALERDAERRAGGVA